MVKAEVLPSSFIVSVDPSSFGINDAVDLIIKAVDEDGNVIKDYPGDVFIDVEGSSDTLFPGDYTVPTEMYTFVPEDQGEKRFSKGLKVKVAGNFKVTVSDIIDDNIRGEFPIIVGEVKDTQTYNIIVITPQPGSVEVNNVVNVLAQAKSLPNSTYQVLVNDVVKVQGTTTQNGDIDTNITGLDVGQNSVQVKIVDVNGISMGQSTKFAFSYKSAGSDSVFNGMEISPQSGIKQGDRVLFSVKTNDEVKSAEIKLSDGNGTPLDWITDGMFTKEIVAETAGNIKISLFLIVGGNKKVYNDVATFSVAPNSAISNVKFYNDPIDKQTLLVEREAVGNVPKFKVEYGTNPENLTIIKEVTTPGIKITGLDPEIKYYMKVTPLDANGGMLSQSSQVYDVVPGHLAGDGNSNGGTDTLPTCVVKGIVISTGMVGDKYYLTRNSTENVDKYIVYRSDFYTQDVSSMKKIGETTDTRFEYWFDKSTRRYTYAYYLVEAICKDGAKMQIESVKKVQVGPMDNIFLLLVFVAFFYTGYKLYSYSKN